MLPTGLSGKFKPGGIRARSDFYHGNKQSYRISFKRDGLFIFNRGRKNWHSRECRAKSIIQYLWFSIAVAWVSKASILNIWFLYKLRVNLQLNWHNSITRMLVTLTLSVLDLAPCALR